MKSPSSCVRSLLGISAILIIFLMAVVDNTITIALLYYIIYYIKYHNNDAHCAFFLLDK